MTIHKIFASQTVKFIFGFIIFILGLTLAFGDVYGVQMPYTQTSARSYSDYVNNKTENVRSNDTTIIITTDITTNTNQDTDNIPTSVPEPTSILLLASGLGILQFSRKKR